MHYTFSAPIQEGVHKGKKFWVVEVSELHGTLCLRRTKIRIDDARFLLSQVFGDTYGRNDKEKESK